MNETTAILFELRALAEQIDQLECQARLSGAGPYDTKLSHLRGQTDALRSSMELARRNRAASSRRVISTRDDELNYSRVTQPPGRAASIVARLGVPHDRLFAALHAIGPINA